MFKLNLDEGSHGSVSNLDSLDDLKTQVMSELDDSVISVDITKKAASNSDTASVPKN